MNAQFHKYHALGSDLLLIDPSAFDIPLTAKVVRRLCERHLGAGADGIVYGPLPDQPHPFTMRFFNPDGSEAEMSGSGLRTFARYLCDAGYVDDGHFSVAIGDRTIPVEIMDQLHRTINLGIGPIMFDLVEADTIFLGGRYQITTASIGNPHCLIFTKQLDTVKTLGPVIEHAPQFPNRTNVQLVNVLDRHTIELAVWERGAGYTLSSGTSASAAAAAAIRTGRCQSPVEVRMAGGTSTVNVDDSWNVTLLGSVTAVYTATLSPEQVAQLAPERQPA